MDNTHAGNKVSWEHVKLKTIPNFLTSLEAWETNKSGLKICLHLPLAVKLAAVHQ